ncbi:DnaJ domain-containing protein [Polycladidibacter stylochi]|uniref:DnaJ domain-containing protein n=1 Tax=Polycladidibacter stylochi TaxID=1807766 RepID=UPI000829AE4E|nr:DnaJ domain-containing protein [Pseudovibrio stylochi]
MAYLLAGLLILGLLLFIAQQANKTNKANIMATFKMLLGTLLLCVSLFLAFTGKWVAGIPLGLVSLGLLGVKTDGGAFLRFLKQRAAAGTSSQRRQTSMVQSKFLAMQLDHETGAMDGEVIAGHFRGAQLSTLSNENLLLLWQELKADGDSLALIEAYLDSRFTDWRVNFEANSASGQRSTPGSSALSDEEAYQILGLARGATSEEIIAAHRRLIKRLHPDSGGSAFLAAKLNEAKERLLG